ncbi:MAG: hypothetical protein V2A73_01385 [Pseudomonadota bacterium]
MSKLFQKIKGAKGTGTGKYFAPGLYRVKIERCKADQMRDGADFFVAECRILESSNEVCPVGSSASFFVSFKKWPDLAMGNVADFMNDGFRSYLLQNAIGMDDFEGVDEELADEITGETQLLANTVIDVEAFQKVTKTTGNLFTHHRWKVVDKDEAEKTLAGYPF